MFSVLITGVARGIGYELARLAISDGFKVYGSVRSATDAGKLIAEFGSQFVPLIFDVTDQDAIHAASMQVKVLDIIINNAGIIGPADEDTASANITDFLNVFNVNTVAPLFIVQAFLSVLRQSKNAKIISISSQMSWMGYAKSDRIAYRASKTALNKIMQGLATDLASENIPICVIDPGWVQTDMGGPDADNDPIDVATGIWDVARNLQMPQSGKFIRWTGEEREY